jgi:hypothetical protein
MDAIILNSIDYFDAAFRRYRRRATVIDRKTGHAANIMRYAGVKDDQSRRMRQE